MLNDVFADDLREREENEDDEKETFQDEVLPVATPLKPPSGINMNSHDQQFDPFAPKDAPAATAASGGGGWDLLTGKSSGTFGAPVLIPSNPDADTDLLGGIGSKPASKATKDPKTKEITYQDDLMTVPKDAEGEEEDKPDNFVDDDDQKEGSGFGFFSRMRNRMPAAASKPKKEGSSDEASPSTTANHNHPTLEDGGNSLPHPDTLRAGSTRDFIDEGSESGSDDGLDGNGNSLPHPDEVARLNDALRTSRTSDGSGDDSGRDSSIDHARLMAALESASSTNSSGDEASQQEEDVYMDEDMEDADANDASVVSEESDSSRGRELDANGNSLPHPDDMIPYSSGHGNSSRWGSLRLGLKKAFSKSEMDIEAESDDEDDFADEAAAKRRREEFDIYVSDVEREDADGHYSSDEDSDEGKNKRRKPSLFQSLHEGMRSALRARKSKNQQDEEEAHNNPTSREHYPDEEMAAFGLDNYAHNNDNYGHDSDDEDDFNDERKAGMSKKERLQAVVSEQWQNPKCRIPCIVLGFILLLLIIVLPIVTREKKTIEPIGESNGTGSNTAIIPVANPNQVCEDEIFLTDHAGNDLVNGTSLSDTVACFTVTEPIHFRFKRCRPASPLDFVGVYPARSMFMNRLWGDFYDGTYLCGGQPCPLEEAMNQIGGPPRAKTTKAPPVSVPGEYRLFLVKDSDWPYELLKYTPSFQVVADKTLCPGRSDNIFGPDQEFNDLELVDIEATVPPTTGTTTRSTVYPTPINSAITSGTVSGTSTGTSSGTVTSISSAAATGTTTGRPDPLST